MIAPLAQPAGFKESFLAIRGVVWDQGEDWATQNRAIQQGALLAALVPAWRTAFGDPALPFAVVQLKPHRYALGVGGIGIEPFAVRPPFVFLNVSTMLSPLGSAETS